MAKRKVTELRNQLQETVKKTKEIEQLYVQAQEEEKNKLNELTERVKTIQDENNIFIGVIIDREVLKNIIDLMIETKENIKIPYRIYFNE